MTNLGGQHAVSIEMNWTGLRDRMTVPVALAILVVGSVAEWLRLPAVTRGTLWAEDARRFLESAVAAGPAPAVLTPYAGYLHTVPRLIAGAAVQFAPVRSWALVMSAGSCIVAAGVAALVFVLSRDVVEGIVPRLLLAAITLLDPLSPREVLGNTANLHWYFLWLSPWLLLYRPRSRVGAWLLGTVALLASLTEIQLLFATPLIAWRWRDRRRWPVRALFLLGVITQLVVTLTDPRGAGGSALIGIPSLALGYLVNAVLPIVLPSSQSVGWAFTHGGPLIGIVILATLLAVAMWGIVHSRGVVRTLFIVLPVSSMVLYTAAVEATPAAFSDYSAYSPKQWEAPWIDRYGVVPSLLLLAVIPLALSLTRRVTRMIGAVALIAVLLAQFTPTQTRRDGGPLLSTQVASASQLCTSEPPATLTKLRGAPGGTWLVWVSCARIRADRSAH